MEISPLGQVSYEEEANRLYPGGCSSRIPSDCAGECDWCRVYYEGTETCNVEECTNEAVFGGSCPSCEEEEQRQMKEHRWIQVVIRQRKERGECTCFACGYSGEPCWNCNAEVSA